MIMMFTINYINTTHLYNLREIETHEIKTYEIKTHGI
jgi:hypothetical protein